MTATATFDTTVRLAIQKAFIDGRATPDVASVSAEVAAAREQVGAAFERLADSHVIVLAPGTHEIVMSAPFAGRATDFVVDIADRSYYANCVWDALGIVAMLGHEVPKADIRTSCADCGDSVKVHVSRGVVTSQPSAAVAHFAVPAARWWDDIGFT